jgi:hypothetical protein
MNPAFGLGELNENQLGANGTYFMVDLTFRMRSIAVLTSTFWEYMRYAAAIVALRPGLHNKSRPRIVAYMRGHALVPAWQWTRMPLPLSSSACMNVIEGIRC